MNDHISRDTPRKCVRCGHHHCYQCSHCHRGGCGCRWYIPTTREQEQRMRRLEQLERWVREASM